MLVHRARLALHLGDHRNAVGLARPSLAELGAGLTAPELERMYRLLAIADYEDRYVIPQAHAVVFILAADTGVTKSDLAIWREHLISEDKDADSRLVVLNKIDTLWDTLNSAEQVQAQLERQRRTSAEVLGIPLDRVVPVSAQKGLVAKITADDLLLESSGLPALEEVLAKGIMGRRQAILRAAVANGVAHLRVETSRVINIRRRDLDDQMAELRSLRGKNASVIESMRHRIEQEQREFDLSTSKIQAVRAVHLKLLREVFQQLGAKALKAELSELAQTLQQKGLKLGVKKIYLQTFDSLRATMDKAQASGTEIQAMLSGTFRQLNAEFGFSLQVPTPPQLEHFTQDLNQIEQSHLQYLGMSNALKLAQPEFSERLVRALAMRLRTVYESAANDLELWSKSATAQLDAQLRERRQVTGTDTQGLTRADVHHLKKQNGRKPSWRSSAPTSCSTRSRR